MDQKIRAAISKQPDGFVGLFACLDLWYNKRKTFDKRRKSYGKRTEGKTVSRHRLPYVLQ